MVIWVALHHLTLNLLDVTAFSWGLLRAGVSCFLHKPAPHFFLPIVCPMGGCMRRGLLWGFMVLMGLIVFVRICVRRAVVWPFPNVTLL